MFIVSTHSHFGLVTAVSIAVLRTMIFCCGYLKINNSAVKQYLERNFMVLSQIY